MYIYIHICVCIYIHICIYIYIYIYRYVQPIAFRVSFSSLKSRSLISFSRSLWPRSVETNEIEIGN